MLTLFRWRQLILRLFGGALLQAALFLSIAVPFAPDLGDASFESRSFLGSLLSTYPMAFANGALPAVVGVLVVGLLMQGASLALGLGARILLPLVFAGVALVRMATLHPALASEWFVYQRSSTVRAIIGWLSGLEPGSWSRALVAWSTPGLLAMVALANMWALSVLLLRQYERFLRARRGFRMDELDLASRRFAMAGVSVGVCALVSVSGVWALWGEPRADAPDAPERLARPHVFVILVDGLRRQVIEPASREGQWAPFLQHLASQSELATPLHSGSQEALPSWMEVATCRQGLRTGVRGLFPARSLVRSPPPSLVHAAARDGYSTLLAADFVGAYLSQIPLPFARSSAPELSLSVLASNSLLRTLAPLQAMALHPRLRAWAPSLLLNPGAADARSLASDVFSLLDDASRDGKPVFATIAFSEPYASVRTDFPFLEHPILRENGGPAAYARGLERVDAALAALWSGLERGGWLRNAVVVLTGPRGYHFFERDVAAVTSDAAFTSPLLIWTSGRARETETIGLDGRIARAIDVAPTLARRMQLASFATDECDGAPLLEPIDKTPRFGIGALYQESSMLSAMEALGAGLDAGGPARGFERWLRVDESLGGRFSLHDGVEETATQLRSRVWLTPKYRYVERSGPDGLVSELYDRERDHAGRFNLLAESETSQVEGGASGVTPDDRLRALGVAEGLRGELRTVLRERGVGWTDLGAGRGLFEENLPR